MDHDLEVCTEVDGKIAVVGRLWLRERNKRETATFRYDPSWMKNRKAYALAPSLPLGDGAFHSDGDIFGPFRDASPDRWGQKLMRHYERDRAREVGTKPRTLVSGDFLIGVDDETRLGALRFRNFGGKEFLSQSGSPVPPLLDLRKLLGATNRLERGKERKGDLELVLGPGGSLGGARPKATLRGKDKNLYVTKFPWAKDEWAVIRWEALALRLAKTAGIDTPDSELIVVHGNAVLLLSRFDRTANNSRVPFMSAMTALDAADHEEHSYLEIVDVLRRFGGQPDADAAQLWRRMVFNVLISNTDDHLRNHALLRVDQGWRLSPAFDMNPCPPDLSGGLHILALNELEHTGSLEIAMSTADYFGLTQAQARKIAGEVATSVVLWKKVADDLAISPHEIEMMSSAFLQEDIESALANKKNVPVTGQQAAKKKKGNRAKAASK